MIQSPFNPPASHGAIFTLLCTEVGEEATNKHWYSFAELIETFIKRGENAELISQRLKAIVLTLEK